MLFDNRIQIGDSSLPKSLIESPIPVKIDELKFFFIIKLNTYSIFFNFSSRDKAKNVAETIVLFNSRMKWIFKYSNYVPKLYYT